MVKEHGIAKAELTGRELCIICVAVTMYAAYCRRSWETFQVGDQVDQVIDNHLHDMYFETRTLNEKLNAIYEEATCE